MLNRRAAIELPKVAAVARVAGAFNSPECIATHPWSRNFSFGAAAPRSRFLFEETVHRERDPLDPPTETLVP